MGDEEITLTLIERLKEVNKDIKHERFLDLVINISCDDPCWEPSYTCVPGVLNKLVFEAHFSRSIIAHVNHYR